MLNNVFILISISGLVDRSAKTFQRPLRDVIHQFLQLRVPWHRDVEMRNGTNSAKYWAVHGKQIGFGKNPAELFTKRRTGDGLRRRWGSGTEKIVAGIRNCDE